METATRYPPIPEGAPLLFQNQDKPFAGDTFMERDFLALRDRFEISLVVETGACYGSTTRWLAEHFKSVMSVEINPTLRDIAISRLDGLDNVGIGLGSSSDLMAGMLNAIGPNENVLCFLDAHFDKHCPLIDELKAIADSGIKPVIAVHDMFVPGRPDLGYDTWNGKRFTFEWLKPHLERIYAGGPWGHHFNNEATGAKRGCLYCYPL